MFMYMYLLSLVHVINGLTWTDKGGNYKVMYRKGDVNCALLTKL